MCNENSEILNSVGPCGTIFIVEQFENGQLYKL